MIYSILKSKKRVSKKSVLIWHTLQIILLIVGIIILYFLIFHPKNGLFLFWDVLITIAPLLFVVALGLWRNICPLATTSLLPRHFKLSKRKKLTTSQSGKLNLFAVILLFLIAPLRHIIFDFNGMATAILLITLSLVANFLGFFYDWKSAWCSGLCPIYPVEKLYGLNTKIELPNVHCTSCNRCITPCPDSTPRINPLSSKKTIYHKIAGFLMAGGFPGFVWGWFQIHTNESGLTNFKQLVALYEWPIVGLILSSLLFLILEKYIKKEKLIALFSSTAVSLYYWFRLPTLLGYGILKNNIPNFNLSSILPEWSAKVITFVLIIFIYYWMNYSKKNKLSWLVRPIYTDNIKNYHL